MPRKTKQTAHAELDELRKQAAGERVKAHDVAAQLEAAKAKVEQASASITAGYAAEDQRAVARARKAEEQAVAQVRELQHRVDGAALRVERAQQQHDEFLRDCARGLLGEREPNARTVAAELTASVHETLRLAKAYVAERQAQDELVAAVPGASPRVDGPASAHPWERQLKHLERVVAEVPESPPPLPRWQGLEYRRAQDSTARRLQLQRRTRRTGEERDELDRLNRELRLSAPRAEAV